MAITLTRRHLILSGSSALYCFPNMASANPLFGLFARLTFSQFAKRAGARVLATSAAQAVVKPIAKKALSPSSQKRMAITQRQMAVAGGFTSLVTDFSGRLAGDIAADAVQYGGSGELGIVHAENPEVAGEYGLAQCLGVIASSGANKNSIMLESPEIVALERLQETALSRGLSGKDTAKMLVPLQMVNNGKFSYSKGHETPAVFDTHAGRVALLSGANNDSGYVEGKFFPKAGSSYDEFSARYRF